MTTEPPKGDVLLSKQQSQEDLDATFEEKGDLEPVRSVSSTKAPTSQDAPPLVEQPQDFGPKTPLTGIRRALVFFGILVTLFLAALDQTIVTTTLPSIAKDFNNFSDISWVGTAYLLTTTAVQPLYGVAADLAGRKRSMLFACSIFMVGSALCGAAQSMTMLIVARTVQGLGGSGIIALTMILVADIVPLRQRGTYQALVALIFAVAAILGPLLGGAFTDNVSWRWAFYINLPIGALAMFLLTVFLHMNRRKNVPLHTTLKSLDYTGIFLMVGSIIMILLGLNWGADAKYPWNSPAVLCLIIIGVVVGAVFILNEWKVAKRPIIPLRLFGTISIALTYLNVFILGFIFLGLLFFLPLYFQAVNGASAVRSGIDLLPYVIVSSVSAIIVGLMMTRFNTYKEFVVAGFIIGTVGSGLMTTFDEYSSQGMIIGTLILQGASMGLTVNTLLLGIHAQLVNKSDIALSTSLWTFLRTFGGVFGIAIGGAFVQSSLSEAGASEYAQNIQAIAKLPQDVKAPILRAFVVGLQRFFILLTVLSGIAAIASIFIKKVSLGPRKDTSPTAAIAAE
ncbi:hypothetical protein BGW38_003086 [Lunasporangiospora selenospora]|uniref:Major facilitator superfamily (MFS) profile domain-containing protein n=1 Tax=Lunasporangiospora selenospora TaxID=979761 RepID=A0A9P6KD33_9FUNG|nr:hypothetical protein BGW38_003086 [Lunasporangiospora selenospora]